MTDRNNEQSTGNMDAGKGTSRRKLLKIGAAAVPAAMTLRGGAAWAASGTCTIAIPELDPNFGLQPSDPQYDQFATDTIPAQVVFGKEVKENPENLQPAQMRYLLSLQEGTAGATCVVSSGIA